MTILVKRTFGQFKKLDELHSHKNSIFKCKFTLKNGFANDGCELIMNAVNINDLETRLY